MIPPLDASTGALPIGRWPATLDDVKAMFATTDWRQQIWDEFERVTEAVESLASVHAMWLSGSYLTIKPNPGDIDAVYWTGVPGNEDVAKVLRALPDQLRASPYHVDGFPVPYTPAFGAADNVQQGYCQNRGYWDDLWGRLRDSDPYVDCRCRRGYVEVIVDGY